MKCWNKKKTSSDELVFYLLLKKLLIIELSTSGSVKNIGGRQFCKKPVFVVFCLFLRRKVC